MVLCSNNREPAMQVWPPAAKMPAIAPTTAASKSASSKTMFGDLPPSSSATCLNSPAAASLILRPPASDPVMATLTTSVWATNAAPASWPKPVTTLTTPAGNPACSNNSTKSSVDVEVNSEGLTTTVLPAASAVANLLASSRIGEFQ